MSPLLLGHRGHRLRATGEGENTLKAFDRALEAGCDGIEFDVHRAADGRLVVHHDPAVRTEAGLVPIAEATLTALRRLRPEMPTLEQVLRRYRKRAWMDIEVKATEAASGLVEAVRQWRPERGFVVSSFDAKTLAWLAEAAPELPLCLNLRRPCGLRRLQELVPGSWVAPAQAGCTGWYARRLRAAGWRVLVWTVNRPAKMRLLARAGVEAIVSDDPYLLAEILGREQTG